MAGRMRERTNLVLASVALAGGSFTANAIANAAQKVKGPLLGNKGDIALGAGVVLLTGIVRAVPFVRDHIALRRARRS
jgi:hypothetical protein